jgi:hypothetical protein
MSRSKQWMPVIFSAAVVLIASGSAQAGDPALTCEKSAAKALQSCVKLATKAQAKCYAVDGTHCAVDDSGLAKALAKVAKSTAKCGDDATVQSVGYGPTFTLAGLNERVAQFCLAEARSLAARSFGGPAGAPSGGSLTLSQAGDCVFNAHKVGAKHLSIAAKTNSKCVLKQVKSGKCDLTKTAAKIDKSRTKSAAKINGKCSAALPLEDIIAVDVDEFIARTEAQAECMVAATHPDVAPLDLDCGPRAAVPSIARETYVQVVLDQTEWGTKCGDGSDYAFWVRLPAAGLDPSKVVIGMQGGGVCIFESDCLGVPAGLFEALTDLPQTEGIMSNDALVSPLHDFTKVFLPYCTQDVFSGGGATSDFDGITVERFGGVNTRATLRYVRDLIWGEMDATTTAGGYDPDKMRVYFGGFSAGAFGTLYNLHYVLDDLQWQRTTAFPDAALALDSGGGVSIASLAAVVINDIAPNGWGNRDLLPPYCFTNDCPVGPVLLDRSQARMEYVPEQQWMILSNQNDATQVSTTFFPSTDAWVNEMRTQYCATKDYKGVNYFLQPTSTSIHVISATDLQFTTVATDGQLMNDWIGQSLSDPDGVVDRVQEGTLVDDIPGVDAFPCAVAP